MSQDDAQSFYYALANEKNFSIKEGSFGDKSMLLEYENQGIVYSVAFSNIENYAHIPGDYVVYLSARVDNILLSEAHFDEIFGHPNGTLDLEMFEVIYNVDMTDEIIAYCKKIQESEMLFSGFEIYDGNDGEVGCWGDYHYWGGTNEMHYAFEAVTDGVYADLYFQKS
jgi:hypothetical protein